MDPAPESPEAVSSDPSGTGIAGSREDQGVTKDSANPVETLFNEAVQCVARGDRRKALFTLFKLLKLDPRHAEGLKATAKLVTMFNDLHGAELMEKLAEDDGNPDLHYELGYHFINMGQPDVAKTFLESCLQIVGDNPDVLYELGYCNFMDQKYGRAAAILKRASENLDPERALAADLLQVECLLYDDRYDEGRDLLGRIEPGLSASGRQDSVDALAIMYHRFKITEAPRPYDLRTWHFIKQGGVLLAQSDRGKSGGHFDAMAMNALAVGGLLRLLKGLVKGIRMKVDAVLHVDGDSLPLALAVGSLLERPVRAFAEKTGNDEMLVIPDLDCLDQARVHPVSRDEVAHIFCFQAFPLREYLIVPEILGLMALRFRFPWQERVEIIHGGERPEGRSVPADDRSPEEIGMEIADAARMLPEDSRAGKMIDFYRRHRAHLVSSSVDRYPERRFFNPLTPLRRD